MKKILLILLLSFNSIANAQQYFPMLDSINEWHYFGVCHAVLRATPCFYGGGTSFSFYSETTGNDTIINSLHYKEINSNQFCNMGYIREDTVLKKVYFIDNQFNPEIILYDFSLNVTDSIYLNFPVSSGLHNPGYYRLDSIVNTNIISGNRRAFYFNPLIGSNTLVWIEGVGCTEALLYPYSGNINLNFFPSCPEVQHQSSQFLICFNHSTKIYFDDCAYQTALTPGFILQDSCTFTNYCDGIVSPENSTFSIFPNPAIEKITLSYIDAEKSNLSFSVTDINGRLIKNFDSAITKPIDGKITLYTNDLSPGIYFLEGNADDLAIRKKLVVTRN